VFSALFDADGAPKVTGEVVVIGLGNTYRSDDGVGIVAAAALDELALPGVRVVTDVVDPMSLLEAWSGAGLAVVIDAAVVTPSTPGRVRSCTLSDLVTSREGLSSHSVDIGRTHALGQVLRQVPDALAVFTVEVADTRHGIGLTPQVARAVPEVVGMAVSEIKRRQPAIAGGPAEAADLPSVDRQPGRRGTFGLPKW
jgi:hydrogenase maturation protease